MVAYALVLALLGTAYAALVFLGPTVALAALVAAVAAATLALWK
jgi:hypothetical protein